MSTPFLLSYGALWLLVVGQGLVLLGVVRAVYRMQEHAVAGVSGPIGGGLDGELAPEFYEADVFGEIVDGSSFAGRRRAFLFVSPSCPSCNVTTAELQALQKKADDNVVVVCRGSIAEGTALAEKYEHSVPVVLDQDFRIGARFEVAGLPTAVLINDEDRVQSYGHPGREGESDGDAVGPRPHVQEVFA